MPTFRTNCPDGSHFVQDTTTNPCSLLSPHKPTQNTSTHTEPHPKTPPFLAQWPELESGQNELHRYYSLGEMDPNWAKCFEKWAKLV